MNTDRKKALNSFSLRIPSTLALIISLALILSSLGCNSKPTEIGTMEIRPGEWSIMDIDQRKQHMRQVVLPIATSVFQSWRPERYVNVGCTLCHGQGFYDENFHMPTNHLPRLSGDLLLGTEFKSQPETTRLKLNQLVPRMAAALGKKKFSIITRSGFGCYSCHLGQTGPMFGN